MSDEQRPGDPADRAADGAFGGVQSHRAGYGDDLLERLIEHVRLRPTATLASGEGGMLVQHILLLRARIEGMTEAGADAARLLAYAKVYEKLYADARAEIERLERILAALREPSETIVAASTSAWHLWNQHVVCPMEGAIRAAVTAAKQEVGE